jgi:hypothetical protein
MLIKDYDVEVFTPPGEPGAERFAARARLMVDISELLPYLNATLRGAVYNLSAQALTWKKAGITLLFMLTRSPVRVILLIRTAFFPQIKTVQCSQQPVTHTTRDQGCRTRTHCASRSKS